MDINKMREELSEISNSIHYDEAILKTAKDNNEKLLKYEEKYMEYKGLADDLDSYCRKLKVLYAVINKKATDFTQGRKALIEQTVEENLAYIFPEERFKVKLNLDVSKTGRESCQLLLGKQVGNDIVYSPTSAQNGRFVRQLISVVIVSTINYLRGSDMLYMDEALASSDKHNLTKLKPLLDRLVENGIQILMIEHKSELYDAVDRRHFILEKNRVMDETKVVSVEDIRRYTDE